MDFGVLYLTDRAANRAAAWLGFFVVLLFVILPIALAYLFVPLYIAVIIMAAIKKFKIQDPAFTLLFPLVPFAAALVLCMMFWWCIPFIVNFLKDCRDLLMMNDTSVFKDDLSDFDCCFYFVLILGSSIGSLFSCVSIGSMAPKENTLITRPTRSKWKWDKDDNIDLYTRSRGKNKYYKTQSDHVLHSGPQLSEDEIDKWKRRYGRKHNKRPN
jgi:lysylphosphatidylglycerol synthetase-like protein (DUF2156 family)